MTEDKRADFFRKNGIFYGIGGMLILGLKWFGSRAGFRELEWILAPTARWAELLSGIQFVRQEGIGYVSHAHRFLIAPSCAGLQFFLVTAAMLLFSFVHRMGTKREGVVWTGISLTAAWALTVFVNGLRIVLAVFLPEMLEKTGFFSGWMTPERFHTVIGIIVYFTALLFIYRTADAWLGRREGREKDGHASGRYLAPVFWYFFIVLGLPFLNRAGKNDPDRFFRYTFLMTGVCLPLLLLFWLAGTIKRQCRREAEHKNTRP